jgi:ABC-type multidrug transport system fused ATPase/permease subunit
MDQPTKARRSVGAMGGLRRLYAHLTAGLRREFFAVLLLMLLGGFAELATIGAVVPFLALLSNSGSAHLSRVGPLFMSLGNAISIDSVTVAAIILASFAILAGLVRISLTWLTQKFIYGVGHHLALEALRKILSQPYTFHADRDVAALLATTVKVEILLFDLILPAMQTIIAAFIAFFVIAGLIYIDPLTTIATAAAFASIYLLVSLATRKRLAVNSAIVETGHNERFKIVNESLGGIRDVIIDNSRSVHTDLFDRINAQLARARAVTAFIAASPRFMIEALGIVLIAAMAVIVSGREGGIAMALPFLGALALGAQRLLPLVQTVYNGWSSGAGNRSIIGQVVELLTLPDDNESANQWTPLPFERQISFENVSFSYSSRPGSPALKKLTFVIPRGSMVAVTGKTGAGKSTLADLLMALLEPDAGEIKVDGTRLTRQNARSWQRNIAHVPQSIFLADTTIAANIALGLPQEPTNRQRVREAAAKAQLNEFVQSLPNGYETIIGERGIRLSGGQRQRLGLARALYKNTPLLVLDEATSALDEATEQAVFKELEQLRKDGRTMIIIAHRVSTIAHCDLILNLHDGRVVDRAAGCSRRLR